MKININEDSELQETRIIIECNRIDEKINKILEMLHMFDEKITGISNKQTYILDVIKILYIDTVDKKTFLYTKDNVYETPLKLYELEERLAVSDFFRVSKSCIINFNQIKSLRPDIDGRILVTMNNNEKLLVSRQYAVTIKKKLGDR